MVFARDADRQLWLATLAEMVEGFGVVVHCYCIMGNHYHLVVATPSANLSAAMGWFQTTFHEEGTEVGNPDPIQCFNPSSLLVAHSLGKVRIVGIKPVHCALLEAFHIVRHLSWREIGGKDSGGIRRGFLFRRFDFFFKVLPGLRFLYRFEFNFPLGFLEDLDEERILVFDAEEAPADD
jgi:hypothetical protein